MKDNDQSEANPLTAVEMQRGVMPTKVYLLVEETSGAAGHGEGAPEHTSLAYYGNSYTPGPFFPAFSSYEKAEELRKEVDKYDFYKVIELPIKA